MGPHIVIEPCAAAQQSAADPGGPKGRPKQSALAWRTKVLVEESALTQPAHTRS